MLSSIIIKCTASLILLSASHHAVAMLSGNPSWNYQDFDRWAEVNPICVNGKRQSPIHISTHEAVMDPTLFRDPLQFINYAASFSGNLVNTGYSVSWVINASSPEDVPRIAGGGLGTQGYLLDQLHFHWGAPNNNGNDADNSLSVGSEHVIDYRPAPMEVHLIHRNAKYQTLEEAMSQPDGLAVLGFLFVQVDDNFPDGDYDLIAKAIPQVTKPNSKASIWISLHKIIPSGTLERGVYYRYDGSLTTPPCYESVKWTVYADRLPITKKTLDAFRGSIMTSAGGPQHGARYEVLENNFRPFQRQNDRTVVTNQLVKIPADFAYKSAYTSGAASLSFCSSKTTQQKQLIIAAHYFPLPNIISSLLLLLFSVLPAAFTNY